MSKRVATHFVEWLPLPWVAAITLPPFGIFIRRDRYSMKLLHHENAHWRQYLRVGSAVAYYVRYVGAWVRCGFSYKRHPWEKEARALSIPRDHRYGSRGPNYAPYGDEVRNG